MKIRMLFGVIGMIVAVVALAFSASLMEYVDQTEIVGIQFPNGHLVWKTSPGWTMQWGGKVASYNKRGLIEMKADGGDNIPPAILFNDAGKATLSGSINYELPLDQKQLTDMHSFYPDSIALEKALIQPALKRAINISGSLMSSYESYKERRPQLIQYIEDQTQNGVYLTQSREVERVDEFTQEKRRMTVVEIVKGEDAQPARAEKGQLARFGLTVFNLAVEPDYDAAVKAQIAKQQEITMATQTAIASARQAEQNALTAEATARQNIAEERARQEVGKTQAVVVAERDRDVAKLKSEQAEFYKRERVLRADADSEYNRRILEADGALERKLATYQVVNATWAEALAKFQGQLVPGVVMGGGGGAVAGSSNAVTDFMHLLGAKAALDLKLDVSPGGKKQ